MKPYSVAYCKAGTDVVVPLIFAILAAILVLVAVNTVNNGDIQAVPIHRAQIILSDAAAPPPDEEPGWEEVILPDDWRLQRPDYGGYAWYRTTARVNGNQPGPWAIYLPRISMNAAVFLNNHYIGSGGAFEPVMARNWNRPLYFLAPEALLRHDENVLHIRLRADAWEFGLLGKLYFAPEDLLIDAFERQYFIQITFVEAATLIMLATGLFVGVIWLLRRDMLYGWFSLAALTWSITNTNLYLKYVPLPDRIWEWVTGISLLWMIVIITMLALRFVQKLNTRVVVVVVTVALAGSILDLVLPKSWYILIISYSLMAIFSVYVLSHVLSAYLHKRDYGSGALFMAGAIMLFIGVHDLLVMMGWTDRESQYFLPTGSLLMFVVIGGALVSHFINALRKSESLAREMEIQVVDKQQELENKFIQLRRLEQQRILGEERDRIMRDMHDVVGSHLIAALSETERGGSQALANIAVDLQMALEDLRLIIDSLEQVDNNLAVVLGMFRDRMKTRIASSGLEIRWQVEELPPVSGLQPQMILQILRILQEAITNVMKHARASTITVSARTESDSNGRRGASIEVTDDGVGFSSDSPQGRGLSNMRHRAQTLGGTLDILPGHPGLIVKLWLPVD
jgi:signal transduction histidine kinase